MSNLGKLYSELSDANLTCVECGANHYGREYECLDCHIPGKLDKLRKQIQQIEDLESLDDVLGPRCDLTSDGLICVDELFLDC